jgi:hypothetical protein
MAFNLRLMYIDNVHRRRLPGATGDKLKDSAINILPKIVPVTTSFGSVWTRYNIPAG